MEFRLQHTHLNKKFFNKKDHFLKVQNINSILFRTFRCIIATLEYPYEQSIEKRAQWTIEQIKKSRADGVIFIHNWGCNTQAAISRPIVDFIKRETGIPTYIHERDLHGLRDEQEQNRVNAFIEML